MNFSFSNIFRWLFMPHFNEVSLFSMSLACVLLLVTNFDSSIKLNGYLISDDGVGLLIVYGVLLCGFCLSIYHAFSNRPKNSFEKIFMILFASSISGFGGIWAGTFLWYHTNSWMRILPIWNIVSGYILLASVRDDATRDQRISDENSSLAEVGLCTLITVSIFALCQYVFWFHWAGTFAISVAYATTFNGPILDLIFLNESEMRET